MINRRNLLCCASLGAVVSLASPAVAQVVFTFTGTVAHVPREISHFAVGDPISITFVSMPLVTGDGSLSMTQPGPSGNYQWHEELMADPQIWASVSFTGATGVWSRPDNDEEAPESSVYFGDIDLASRYFLAVAYADYEVPGATMGLSSGGFPVVGILVQGLVPFGSDYTFGAPTPPEMTGFFADFVGSHSFTFSGSNSLIDLDIDPGEGVVLRSVMIDFTQMSIAVIPEPAAAGLLMGMLGASAAFGRRRARAGG